MYKKPLRNFYKSLTKFIKKGPYRDRTVLLLIAFGSRVFLGLIFFGSIDLINALNYSRSIIAGQSIIVPYFPVIVSYLWLGAVINVHTALPLAFAYKVIPILFDSLIPLLLYEILTHKQNRFAFRIGLLYAISPVALLITVFHVQYDSVFVFFLLWSFFIRDFYKPSAVSFLLFGMSFAFMFLMKPMGLLFLPLALQPLLTIRRDVLKYLTPHFWSLIGLGGTFLFAAVFFKAFNYDLAKQWQIISDYGNHGVQIFGLPFAKPFSDWAFLHSRNWIVVCVLILAFFYHLKLLRQYTVILLTFAFIYAFAGLDPQYLIWILPFLLVEEQIRLAGIYTILVGSLLAFYYFNPNTSFAQWENLTTFTTLRRFSFLMPPVKFYGHTVTNLTKFGLNYLVPAFGAVTFVYCSVAVIVSKWRIKKRDLFQVASEQLHDFNSERLHLLFIIAAIGNWALIGLLYVTLETNQLTARFNAIYLGKMAHYNFVSTTLPPLMIPFIGDYSKGTYFNIVTILVLLSIGSGLFMLWSWKKESKN